MPHRQHSAELFRETMQKSDSENISRLSRLSGLSLSEEEKEILSEDLSRILPYMERVSELQMTDACPDPEETYVSSFREDEAYISDVSGKIRSCSQNMSDGMFTVPKTVE